MKNQTKRNIGTGTMMFFIGTTVLTPVLLAMCGDKPGPEEPVDLRSERTGGTGTSLPFGTGLSVKVVGPAGVLYTDAEWNAIRTSAAGAVGRGYGAAPTSGVKTNIENHFKDNEVIIVLSTTLTRRCEVRAGEANKIYLKADGNTIDGLAPADMLSVIDAVMGGNGGAAQIAKAKTGSTLVANAHKEFNRFQGHRVADSNRKNRVALGNARG